MTESMLKEVRRNAGLGDPPTPYYTNVPESANALIKRGVDFKQNEISDFCREMGILLSRQKEDVDSAIINKGPYRLASDFASFEMPQSDWFKMNAKQREAHLRKFHAKGTSKVSNVDQTPLSGSDNVDDTCSGLQPSPKRVRLSVDLGRADVRSVPSPVLNNITEKAEKLLNCEGSVVRAPGAADKVAYMVESQTSKRPHYVTLCKNGKVTCEDCPGWKASKICSHAIAAAEKAGATAPYVKWLREKGPVGMNVSAMVTFDSNSGTGKKGGKASTARRKGGRTGNQPEVTTVIDRPFITNVGNSSRQAETVSQVPSLQTPQVSTAYPVSPNPKLGEFIFYLLQFCPPMVRSCYGCSQPLKPGGFIASPPYDLVIVSRMNRGFRATPQDEMMYKEGNVYFHLRHDCIRMKQPYFSPQITFVAGWLVQYLRQEHIQLLREFGLHIQ